MNSPTSVSNEAELVSNGDLCSERVAQFLSDRQGMPRSRACGILLIFMGR